MYPQNIIEIAEKFKTTYENRFSKYCPSGSKFQYIITPIPSSSGEVAISINDCVKKDTELYAKEYESDYKKYYTEIWEHLSPISNHMSNAITSIFLISSIASVFSMIYTSKVYPLVSFVGFAFDGVGLIYFNEIKSYFETKYGSDIKYDHLRDDNKNIKVVTNKYEYADLGETSPSTFAIILKEMELAALDKNKIVGVTETSDITTNGDKELL